MKVLITAGPTWVKIDQVRILTNRFSGKTGLYLARQLSNSGDDVTLLINPYATEKIKDIKTLYFHYFEEFQKKVENVLRSNHYDAIIHMAAVSDYLPKKIREGKIPSGRKDFNIELVSAPKIIKIIRKLAKRSILIQFKLEIKKEGIINKAYQSLKANGSDYVVANALEELKSGYKAVLVDQQKKMIEIKSKGDLAKKLEKIIITQYRSRNGTGQNK